MKMANIFKFVSGWNPIDTTGSAITSDWVNLAGSYGATVVLMYGVAGTTSPAITLDQGTTAAGASTKTLGFSYVYSNTATGTSDTLVKTAVTSDTFNKGTTTGQMYLIEIDADTLDVDNGFHYINVDQATPGANACLVSCLIIVHTVYSQDQPPTVIT